jgi:sigma-E factor negative regulatory protein RseA
MVMEKISALMDGELEAVDVDRQVARLKDDAELRERWDTFHLIGDAMRGNRMLSQGFERGVAQRLAAEPTVLAPTRRTARRFRPAMSYALPAVASLCAVAVVAWMTLSGNVTADREQAPASVAMTAPGAGPNAAPAIPNVPDDGRMHEYLLAHQGVSPSTALQGVAPYVRTVTFMSPHNQGEGEGR